MVMTVGVGRRFPGNPNPVAKHELGTAIGPERHDSQKDQRPRRQPKSPAPAGISTPPAEGSDHDREASRHEHEVAVIVDEVVSWAVVPHLLGRPEAQRHGESSGGDRERVKPQAETPTLVAGGKAGDDPNAGRSDPEGDGKVDHGRMKVRRVGEAREQLVHVQTSDLRSRRAFPMTETELRLIAAAANIGDSNMPKNGYRTPAAIGTPAVL